MTADPVLLTDEAIVLRPPSPDEARRLLAGLPRTRWDLSLSSITRWTPGRQADQAPETVKQSRSSNRWFRIGTLHTPPA